MPPSARPVDRSPSQNKSQAAPHAAKPAGRPNRKPGYAMQRSRLRPHAEVDHHQEDGWRVRFFEMDPTVGFFLVATVVGITSFAATIAVREYWFSILGDRTSGGEQP